MIRNKKEMAFNELKSQIVKLMFDFTDNYGSTDENSIYPHTSRVLVDVLTACLNEAQQQRLDYHPFTSTQIFHICYQIGEWYLHIKPLLEGQHNLGHMKEKLKAMICGDGE